MQNFPLVVSQDEINLQAEGLDLLVRKKGLNVVIPVAVLLTKFQQAQPIVESPPTTDADPAPDAKPATMDEARAIAESLTAKDPE